MAHDTNGLNWKLDNTYARLPEVFFARQNPTPVASPQEVVFNQTLAADLGLNPNGVSPQERALIFSGNVLPAQFEPIAQAYAGHQYAHFTMLGDGRAILLGEQLTPSGERFDIQLKGSGPTPFSRRGDGRAALGPMLREWIISEAMHGLGIPTTRSLAVVTTGETVWRETAQPGAILTRVARSHIRVGTFQYAAGQGDLDTLRTLADYTIRRHSPELASQPEPYLAMLQTVIDSQAALIARWMCVGFVHGVMNTDNMALSGETIDYGPCAFMDRFDLQTVFSSIDRHGRYAYGNQPKIAEWNLARFAETLLPLLSEREDEALEKAQTAIQGFASKFEVHWLNGMRAKLGLTQSEATDLSLITTLLEWMEQEGADFTNTFRALASGQATGTSQNAKEWHSLWQQRRPSLELMREHNPAVIPRNHRVEDALTAAVERGDHTPMERLVKVLQTPFEDLPAEFESLSQPGEGSYQTFCGT